MIPSAKRPKAVCTLRIGWQRETMFSSLKAMGEQVRPKGLAHCGRLKSAGLEAAIELREFKVRQQGDLGEPRIDQTE